MAMIFGLITEGPTDQVVLRVLLSKFLGNPDIDTRPVQPNIDATDKAGPGGWKRVLDYCKSNEMAISLQVFDFLVLQIDTDCCEDFGIKRRDGSLDITDEEVVEKTRATILELIGEELCRKYHQKLIFAVSHSSIECWLLPLYFTNNLRKKTINCCETLNQELIVKEGFTLDCKYKREKYYHKICKNIRNKAQIEGISVHNNSFNQFVTQLAKIGIKISNASR